MSNDAHVIVIIVWSLLIMIWSVVLLVMLLRRGRRAVLWIGIGALGAAASFMLVIEGLAQEHRLLGLIGIGLMGVALLGFRKPRPRKGRCPGCGYDFRGDTKSSSTRCPECGAGRPEMAGHCLECRMDIRQALAGGSIVCPGCGAAIGEKRA